MAANSKIQWTDDTATMHGCRRRLFKLIDATPHLDWLLLTKRPENILRMWPCPACYDPLCGGAAPKKRHNVWLGTSIATQDDANRNIPLLLQCRDLAQVLFLSVEPLVESINLSAWLRPDMSGDSWDNPVVVDPSPIDWVIVGGESGPQARPCNVAWVRSIVRQCQAAGVPCFVKQLGALVHASDAIDPIDQFPGDLKFSQGPSRETAVIHLRDKKGGDPAEWPEDLQIRELPVAGDSEIRSAQVRD